MNCVCNIWYLFRLFRFSNIIIEKKEDDFNLSEDDDRENYKNTEESYGPSMNQANKKSKG